MAMNISCVKGGRVMKPKPIPTTINLNAPFHIGGKVVLNWGDDQRNREARTGVSASRKSKMMKPDKENATKTVVTMRVVFDNAEEADMLLEALTDLDNDGLFPTGADIKTEYDYNA
jgi:hypothetical protein